MIQLLFRLQYVFIHHQDRSRLLECFIFFFLPTYVFVRLSLLFWICFFCFCFFCLVSDWQNVNEVGDKSRKKESFLSYNFFQELLILINSHNFFRCVCWKYFFLLWLNNDWYLFTINILFVCFFFFWKYFSILAWHIEKKSEKCLSLYTLFIDWIQDSVIHIYWCGAQLFGFFLLSNGIYFKIPIFKSIWKEGKWKKRRIKRKMPLTYLI